MKLRQKLAAVLATAMIVTSVPMVTMAASENTITRGIVLQAEDSVVETGLKISMKDMVNATGVMFFVNLENAEWAGLASGTITDPVTHLNISYIANGKKEVQVTVKAAAGTEQKGEFVIPVKATLTGGDATVAVDGNGTVISNTVPVVFAKTSEANAAVTAEEATSIYEAGTVAAITVEEALEGTLTSTKVEDRVIKLALENNQFDFTATTAQILAGIELSKGFSAINKADIAVAYGNSGADKQLITVTLPAKTAAELSAVGRIKFTGLTVKAKKPSVGVINIKVTGDKVNTTSVKVAEVKTFGNSIEMEDQKAVEIVSGRKEEMTFSISEIVNDSILENREIEVKLDKGYLTKTNAAGQTLVPTVKLNDTTLTVAQVTAMNIRPITGDDDYVTGFTFITPALNNAKADEITFVDMPVFVPLTVSGDITISAEGRALAETMSAVAAKAKAPVEITTEAMTLKVGLKDQKGGKITIKETDKEMLEAGNIEIELPDESGLNFEATKPVVKVTAGDLQLGEWKIQNNKLIIDVKRTSNTASTIEITDLIVTTDRIIPEGAYNVVVGGEAFVKATDVFVDASVTPAVANDDKNTIEVKDFIVIGTSNTEELAANGLKKGIATFAIGSKNFTMNGVKQIMDGSPFISNGRTMVPVRYVANALGVNASDIYFAQKTVTVIAGSKTISLEIGNKVAKLNGVAARVMTAVPVIKEGRTYVPVSEIGALLGVDASWNDATKVATFENK